MAMASTRAALLSLAERRAVDVCPDAGAGADGFEWLRDGMERLYTDLARKVSRMH